MTGGASYDGDDVRLKYPGAKTRFSDMNVANGGVARNTPINSTVTYTTVFSYSGSGHLFGFLISLQGNLLGGDPFNVRLQIDGETVFEISTADVGTDSIYNLDTNRDEDTMGMSVVSNVFRFACPRMGGLHYETSISIAIKKAAGGAKDFRAGAVYHTRET